MFSIRTRLILLALIAVVPLGFDRMQSLETTRAEQIRIAHIEAMELARRGAEAHAEALTAVRSLLKVLSHTEAIARGLRHDCRLLDASMASMPWLRSLSLTDSGGRVVCSTMADKIGADISMQPYFRAAAGSKAVLSDYMIGPISNQPTILATQPVPAADGSVRAVLIATLGLQWMERLIGSIESRSGAAIALVNGNGALIDRHPETAAGAGLDLAQRPLIREMMMHEEGESAATDVDGVRRIGAFVRLPSTDSRLAVGLDERRLLSRIDREVGLAYLQFGVFILIALLAAWVGGERLIVDPIRSLAQAVARLGRGDLDARIPREGWVAEFAPLAAAFDDMTRRLAMRERELRAANRHYEELASIDALSGLANRRAFDARLKSEWQRAAAAARPLALLLFDVDHFKSFNDRRGHLEGDTCLRQVGEALASVATGSDAFAARYGGDEFALLLPGADEPQALATAERLRKAIVSFGLTDRRADRDTVTISVGAASLVPRGGDQPESLIAAADLGLYAAKDRGRDTVVGHAAISLVQVG